MLWRRRNLPGIEPSGRATPTDCFAAVVDAESARRDSNGGAGGAALGAPCKAAAIGILPLEHLLRCHPDALLGGLLPRETFAALPAVAQAVASALAPDELGPWVAGGLWTSSPDFANLEQIFLDRFFLGAKPPSAALAAAATKLRRADHAAKELRWVLQWRADPNESDASGWPPIIWAAQRGSPQLCRQLIASRAEVDQYGKDGSTALSIACRCAHVEVVQALLEGSASISRVPIGQGNFDHHVGGEILAMLREKRRHDARDKFPRPAREKLPRSRRPAVPT